MNRAYLAAAGLAVLISLAALALSVVSLQQVDTKNRDLQAMLEELSKRVDLSDQLDKRVSDLESFKSRQEFQNGMTEDGLNKIPDSSPDLTTLSHDYSMAWTEYGAFNMAVENIAPQLDGYRITLRIGNFTSATFKQFKIKVSWGLPFSSVSSKTHTYEEYKKSLKSREFQFTDDLLPGRYTQIQFILSPANPEEVKTISASLQLNTVSLLSPSKN